MSLLCHTDLSKKMSSAPTLVTAVSDLDLPSLHAVIETIKNCGDSSIIQQQLGHALNYILYDEKAKEHDDVKLQCVKLLIDSGANVNLRSPNGHTLLSLSILHSQCDEIIRCLLEAGSEVNSTGPIVGETPLLLAAQFDRHGVIRMMSQYNLNMNKRDNYGITAVMIASMVDASVETVKLLIELGVDLNIRNEKDLTVLMLMCGYRYFTEDLLTMMIRAGADISLVNESGSTALLIAVRHKNTSMCNALIKAGASMERELHAAINSSLTEVVYTMLRYGAMPVLCSPTSNPNLVQISQISPLFAAFLAEKKDLSLIRHLISIHFFNEFDLCLRHDFKAMLKYHLESESEYECLGLADSVYSQPLSLWTLSFVKISTCVGFQSNRRLNLSHTGLPNSLQDKLMFGGNKDS